MALATSTQALIELWTALGDRKTSRSYAPGDILFNSGSPAGSVFLVDEGQVKLVLAPNLKGRKAFEVAGPGAVLGLSEVMTGSQYNLSAEAIDEVRTSIVDRGVLMEYLRDHHEFCMQVVRMLSENLHTLYFRFRSMTPESKAKKRLPHVM